MVVGRVPVMGAAQVAPDGTSVRAVAVQVEREFAGVVAWYGAATRAWWAMVRVGQGFRLVEALNPRELREAILRARGWSWPG